MTLLGLFSRSEKDKKPVEKVIKVNKDEATDIWLEGFRAGFDKAWTMIPEIRDDIRRKIESQAINETLRRLNRGDLLP